MKTGATGTDYSVTHFFVMCICCVLFLLVVSVASNKESSIIICQYSHNSIWLLCMSALTIFFCSVQKLNVWVLTCASSLEFPKYGKGFHIGKGAYDLKAPLAPKEGLPKCGSEREGWPKNISSKTLEDWSWSLHSTAGVFYDFEHALPWDVSFGRAKLVLTAIVWAFLCYFDTGFLTAQVGLKLDKAKCDSKSLRLLLLPPQWLGSHASVSHLDSESAGNLTQDLCHVSFEKKKYIIIVCLSLFYCL